MSTITRETRLSKGNSTILPAGIRKAMNLEPGDVLEWKLVGETITVIPRKREVLENIIGMISHGGDAVESKRKAQKGRS
ncbi:MAG: AbrB/MazE/SpoVT family DNA-binding domain-containing protein [Methanoregula sp.]|nr:AbrB/MazE/SpoVT family DNA-binding domain-containing protein [Methanoregula sp.]